MPVTVPESSDVMEAPHSDESDLKEIKGEL